jgi:hypothetical protein
VIAAVILGASLVIYAALFFVSEELSRIASALEKSNERTKGQP